MAEVRQKINKEAFAEALALRELSQTALAGELGVNPKSFSRWLNEGYVQSRYLWNLADTLDLSDEEMDSVLMLPKYQVCFRRKHLGETPETVQNKAIDLARAVFGLTHLAPKSKFVPPNLSRFDQESDVAEQIRRQLRIDDFNELSSILNRLSGQGIEVVLIPFKRFDLTSNKEHEAAFSVSNGSRYLIFLDTAAPEQALVFNLCHELAHLFRPEQSYSKEEERFCNEVASELVYPKEFFETHRAEITERISSGSFKEILPYLKTLRQHVGGELFGLTLRLRALGVMSQKNGLHTAILGYVKKSFDALPLLQDSDAGFLANDRKSVFDFWNDAHLEANHLLRFYALVKNAATDGSMSSGRLSELADLKLEWADELVHQWRAEVEQELKAG